jgi:hypothetical protein
MATLTCSVFPASNYNLRIHLKLIIRCRLIILGFEKYEVFMNSRSNERSKVNERVELSRGKEKYGEFETKNMCSGGIFIKKCQNQTIILGSASVTIKFCHNPNLSYQSSHDAIVVHKAKNGVGFKWIHR